MDDQEYITNMWQQYIKPDALPAVPVDLDWYKKYPITKEDLDGTSGNSMNEYRSHSVCTSGAYDARSIYTCMA